MFKVYDKERKENSDILHMETVFYKINSITRNKKEAMDVSDMCADGYIGQKIETDKYMVEIC